MDSGRVAGGVAGADQRPTGTDELGAIKTFLAADHRGCDDKFAEVETAVSAKDWASARPGWTAYAASLERHLQMEEKVFFPEFERQTGMTGGPTQMMRVEHEQMRHLVKGLDAAIQEGEGDAFLGLAETLMLLIQQHNMKEEQILYPMADDAIADADALVVAMQALDTESQG